MLLDRFVTDLVYYSCELQMITNQLGVFLFILNLIIDKQLSTCSTVTQSGEESKHVYRLVGLIICVCLTICDRPRELLLF